MASREFPFPVLGHGGLELEDPFVVWIVFREPVGDALEGDLLDDGPAILAVDLGESHDRIAVLAGDDMPTTKKAKQKLHAQLDSWLAAVDARQAIRFVVLAVDDVATADAWNAWSRARVKKALLPWFVERWPALRSAAGARVLAQLVARCTKTRRPEVIELATGAASAAYGIDAEADTQLAIATAALVERLADDAARAGQLARLGPGLRLGVWAADPERAPADAAVIATIAALDRTQPHGAVISELGEARDSVELHLLALEFPASTCTSLLAVVDELRGDALEGVLDAHLARFATDDDDLSGLLHHGLELELEPLITRCAALAAERDVPEMMSNVVYASSAAGKSHDAVRIGRAYVARYRESHAEPLLATMYTNLLLAYGATAVCDDVCRLIVGELEQLLADDPAYFGAGGNARRDILASAFGSAACGRCVMGDGERAAHWLGKARDHAWSDLAIGANLVCFQHLKDDPHLRPLLDDLRRAEVTRLEAGLKGRARNDVNALFALALTLHNGGFLDDAERYYMMVLALRPKHADSLNNVGNIHGARGHIDEAVASYDRAIEVSPDNPLFHACKAWALARGQRWRDCVSVGDRAVALAPDQATGYFARGAGHLGLGDRAQAARDFRAGVARNPGWRGSEKDDPWFSEIVALVGP
ncbi:MAG: tetratricopeptide repeat protein [Kofleriaceae bacterium]